MLRERIEVRLTELFRFLAENSQNRMSCNTLSGNSLFDNDNKLSNHPFSVWVQCYITQHAYVTVEVQLHLEA